jgi:integrase/recombinase XerD
VLDGKKVKQSLKTRSWEKAEDAKHRMEEGDPAAVEQKEPLTIDYAVSQYIADARERNLSEDTLSKMETIFAKRRPAPKSAGVRRSPSLLEFADLKGYGCLSEFDLGAVKEWRSTWTDEPLAKAKKQGRAIAFFHFCVREDWLDKNPISGRLGSIVVKQTPTECFNREEFAKILDATHLYRDTAFQRGDAMILSGGARIRALVLLMRYSGLRIRDAVTIPRARINPNGEVFLYQAKTGVPVWCPLHPVVLQSLDECKDQCANPNYFFWTGNGKPKTAVADWQRALRRLFAIADLRNPDGTPKRCHPHMFRDTFAVELLLAGRPIEEVSMLLGHTSIRTTEKSYSPWVIERQRKLAEGVKSTWGDNVISIEKKRAG